MKEECGSLTLQSSMRRVHQQLPPSSRIRIRLLGELLKRVRRISKQCPTVMEQVDKLLLIWVEEKQNAGDTVSKAMIFAIAKSLYTDIRDQQSEASPSAEEFIDEQGLNGQNFLVWEVKVWNFLIQQDLWDIVNNPPARFDSNDVEKNQRALSTIILCLEDSQLPLVRKLESAQHCWRTLREAHVRSTVSSQVTLTRQLYRMQLETGQGVTKHLDKMVHLLMQLQEAALEFTELHKVFIVLSSLDASFDVLATTMESVPREQLTMAFLTSHLREEELKRADNMEARGQRVPADKEIASAGRKRNLTEVMEVQRCHICGSASHLRKACPERRKEKLQLLPEGRNNQQRRKRYPQASVVCQPETARDMCFILDSGASNHLIKNPQLLISKDRSEQQFTAPVRDNRIQAPAGPLQAQRAKTPMTTPIPLHADGIKPRAASVHSESGMVASRKDGSARGQRALASRGDGTTRGQQTVANTREEQRQMYPRDEPTSTSQLRSRHPPPPRVWTQIGQTLDPPVIWSRQSNLQVHGRLPPPPQVAAWMK
ncbi:hypothetical protein JRQ81_019483 [Phrynocephalus forsythii]|uniref:CCHC-type domain-containing protein n=1 Tax=Phrynocephalus forsythii TaxID=171643 RepID=A0A9Q1AYK6_9SAUR|nr:hypothetical protein JRQ81_019483 [Phrynocephalus forsythii]